MISFVALALSALAAFTSVSASPFEKRAFTGEATYADQGVGACGITTTDSQLVVGVQAAYFDSYPGATSNPNKNPICGKNITATYEGKNVTVKITDNFASGSIHDLNFSPAAFKKLAPLADGRLTGVKWNAPK